MNIQKPTLYLIPCNHFDLAWRRPFRVDMKNEGRTFVSYSKIEQYYIEDNIALCKKYPEYKFCIESFSVLDEYLRRFPQRKEEIVALGKEGRIFIPGSGYAIIDANMVSGETLVRNFLYGTLESEELLGQKNRQGFRLDAFGNSAQLPQIFRGCEMKHAFQLTYALPDGKYWRGLDGSTVAIDYVPNVGNGGSAVKYPPCPHCKGSGKIKGKVCEDCHGRGIDLKINEERYWPFQVDEEALVKSGAGYIMLVPEEFLPQEATLKRAKEFSKKYDVRFVTPEEPLAEIEDCLEKVDDKNLTEINSSIELNPAQTGCYVTRIKSKQVLHRQEFALFALETLASMAWIRGKNYPFKKLKDIWHELFFTAFHDCVTGTVVDAGYKELQESRNKIDKSITSLKDKTAGMFVESKDGIVTVFNPTGFAFSGVLNINIPQSGESIKAVSKSGNCSCRVLEVRKKSDTTYASVCVDSIAPFTAESFGLIAANGYPELKKSEDRVIENSRFRITADDNGICDIFDKQLNRTVVCTGKYRPGEFILEHDEGDPWRTLSRDCDRMPLSDTTHLVSVEKGEHIQRMTFNISVPNFNYIEMAVSGSCSVTLIEGSDRIDFHTDVHWNNFNHRLRIAFPAAFSGVGIYGIPYGMLAREEYEPQYTHTHVPGINGDYPAQNWGGIQGSEVSIAVLNRGTPSYKTETVSGKDETDLFVTLLRSPGVPSELHEPHNYTMTAWDGMRDSGYHSFDYSLCVYDKGFDDNSITKDSINYSSEPIVVSGELNLPSVPEIRSDNAAVMSVKCSEDGTALILRLNEYRGRDCVAEITVPEWAELVEKVNMLERQGEKLSVSGNSIDLKLHSYEIATLKFYKRTTEKNKR